MRSSDFLLCDSTLILLAYQSAIADGGPPVPLSWDVKLPDYVLEYLWWNEIRSLLHLLLPQCPDPGECALSHPRLFSNARELQDVLEKIDFSALIFELWGQLNILRDLYYLFRWLASAVSLDLLWEFDITR